MELICGLGISSKIGFSFKFCCSSFESLSHLLNNTAIFTLLSTPTHHQTQRTIFGNKSESTTMKIGHLLIKHDPFLGKGSL